MNLDTFTQIIFIISALSGLMIIVTGLLRMAPLHRRKKNAVVELAAAHDSGRHTDVRTWLRTAHELDDDFSLFLIATLSGIPALFLPWIPTFYQGLPFLLTTAVVGQIWMYLLHTQEQRLAKKPATLKDYLPEAAS